VAPTGPRREWFPPSRPRPVEGGIRARSRRGVIGEQWWSHRFLTLLEALGLGGRLDRGRTYARRGQVISMDVEPGAVTALVQGSRARPYRVRIGLTPLSEADWRRAEDAMVARAVLLARLLAGEMPEDIEEAFADCAGTLLPTTPRELVNDCSCPDWGDPCKHGAAVYYLLAEAFDDDPFLILRWRGRDRDTLLDNLRALRGTGPSAASGTQDHDPWAEIERIVRDDLGDPTRRFWEVGDALAHLRFDATPPSIPDAVLRTLDPLEREVAGRPLTDVLADTYDSLTSGARTRLTS
jgi:uncharacterized Zn finger protein